jgi:phage-related protein (TIGR01555 family)
VSRQNNRKRNRTVVDAAPNPNLTTELKHAGQMVHAMKMADMFSNVAARMGYGSPNLTEGAFYPLVRLTQNYALLNSLYRGNWIVRRIINLIPQDMMKNWIKYTSDITPEQVDMLQRVERLTQIKAKLLQGLEWGRLYGGAWGLMMIDGQDDLEEPLDLDSVMPGDFKGLMIADRWSGVYPQLQLVDDMNDPEFGLPMYYQFQDATTRQVYKVHHSRGIRFIGTDLPVWEQWAELYWGGSIIENVYEEIKKRDNTSENIAGLVFQAKLKVLKMENFGELLASTNEKAQQNFYQTVTMQNWLMNNFGLYVMNQSDDFDSIDYSFTGLAEIYQQFMMDVSGASQIPVTKLFGRSPAGLNATGESDLRNYYDVIETEQESRLRPAIEKLLPVLCMSTLGGVPDDMDFAFNPVYTATDEERAKKIDSTTKAVAELYNSGIITQKVALKEVKQDSDETGFGTNITDDDIKKADDEVKDPMEMIGLNGPGIETGERLEVKSQTRAAEIVYRRLSMTKENEQKAMEVEK